MADFNKVMNTIWEVEHNSNPKKILHKNPTERKFTFYGVYPHTKLKSYRKIEQAFLRTRGNLKRASLILSKDKKLYQEVLYFYYKNFWKPLGLDRVRNTTVAKELMIFAVNIGLGTDWRGINRQKYMVKCVQELVGATPDGILGEKTAYRINLMTPYETEVFSKKFDQCEISFYKNLVFASKRLRIYLRGWKNRARYV